MTPTIQACRADSSGQRFQSNQTRTPENSIPEIVESWCATKFDVNLP